MVSPLMSPRQITEAEEALLWLRWLLKDDARIAWLAREPHAVEAHLPGVGHQPRQREPTLAVRLAVIVWRLNGKSVPRKRSMRFVMAQAASRTTR
ncbi:hypothetical protein [uncultured Paracoccus sp.]|uniref:hypothetical protein n=1 Tax=uncultured Paracoccus sp. TaxID=189685 RepID=UPI002623FC66|nr:hypothetical protein [uncultured Paracoccus sp.]